MPDLKVNIEQWHNHEKIFGKSLELACPYGRPVALLKVTKDYKQRYLKHFSYKTASKLEQST